MGTTGPVYRIDFSAVSDEWLLDKQSVPPSGAGLGEFGGQVLTTLTNRIDAGLLTTAGVTNVRTVGVFQPAQAQSWSANAGGVAAATYSAYRAVNGALTLASAGAVTHALSDGDGSLQIAELKLASVKELANDVTVSGEMEPAAYVTERFAGDGTTTAFQLTEAPFRPKAAGKVFAAALRQLRSGCVQYAGLECNRSRITFELECAGADDDRAATASMGRRR